jgi:dTDP-4-amino-4,6-dideoxygalactose transaminase
MSISFIDLKAQATYLGGSIEAALSRVLAHGIFIGGPEIWDLESQLSAFCGARHTITCANGTDALTLVLLAEAIGPGDAVFVPSFSFVATAEVVPLAGATPIFVDVREDNFNIDPESLESSIVDAIRKGLRPRAVIAVDLFGLPADYNAINELAEKHKLTVIADSAQSFGASYHGSRTGTLATYTTTSFFPAKPLGCYGDGGAIFTADDGKAQLLRSLAVHGKGAEKYDNVRIGLNSRLDTLQAAILIEKLAIFDEEIEARNRIALRYSEGIGDVAEVPIIPGGSISVWAQYTLKIPNRERFVSELKMQDIPTAVYYPTPLHLQTGYRCFPVAPSGLPVSERLSQQVVSLPMHPYLDVAKQNRIIEAVRGALRVGT